MKPIIILGALFGILVAGFLALQLIPYGRDHTNPPIVQEPAWDSPATRQLAQRACFDCHSNETAWPWYTNVAPVSWLTQRDVDEGRRKLNFSDINRRKEREDEEISEVIEEGEMPPWFYVMIHPEADLSAEEKQQLINGLQNSLR